MDGILELFDEQSEHLKGELDFYCLHFMMSFVLLRTP